MIGEPDRLNTHTLIMSQKRKRSEEASPDDSAPISRSEPIEDRSSTFVGYFAPTIDAGKLQKLPEIQNASHRILGYRRESNQRSLTVQRQYITGHDDDGEKYGGKRVEKVLESMKVVGACVVARWYGGVMLGPVRFTHIEECAKGAISKWQQDEADQRAKKRKVDEEAVEQKRIAAALVERDKSIDVLRKMAAKKEGQVKDGIVAGAEALTGGGVSEHHGKASHRYDTERDSKSRQSSSPIERDSKPAIDYTAMPLQRLRALDKARDATLSFLLKRIDRAETDLRALKNGEEAERIP